ncbi:unnamed protein product [Arctia plantaginis]|uniref:U1-type domain-containing protein n=1 Tax=Arctia plantaginis TaxID=874455 RepID=A0A8S1BHQ6_ARCPL|nr:unnamed protein product [Arctia plantaginis]
MPDEDVYDEADVINCHVCDVVVPRAYFRIHAQSRIHQNNKKISALFVENLFSDYTLLAHDVMKNRHFNSFYCTSCVRLVPDDQTLAHGLSVEHFKSTEKESALNVFVEMFIDKKREESADLDDILFYEVEDDEVDSGLNPHQPEGIASGSNGNQPSEISSTSNSYQATEIASGSSDHQAEGRPAWLDHTRAMFRRKINGLWSHDLVSNKYYLTRPQDAIAKGNDKPHPVNNTPKVTEAPTLTNKNNSFVHCEVCDINIHGHNFAGHVQGKHHRRNQRKIDKQNIQATQNSVQTQEDQQEYGITQDHVDDRNGPMDVEAFMVYLKEMVSKYNLKYTLPIVKNGGLVVVTSHGFEAATTVESFHGYWPTESSMYCQLCEMTVSVNTRVHSETRIHVKNITQAIDVHFTRKISVVTSHCLLCNLTVSDSAEHATTDPTHYSYMKDRVSEVKQIEGTADKKRKLSHCDVCNIYLTPNTYEDHLKGKRHLQTIREYSDQRETPANMIFCPICLRTIHCNSFQEHCNGKRHSALAKRTARESQTQCEPTDQGDTAR